MRRLHRRAMAARNPNSRSQIASRCKRRHSSSTCRAGESAPGLAEPSNRGARRENAERDAHPETRACATTHARNSSSLKCRRAPRGQRISAARYLPCDRTFTSRNTGLQMPPRCPWNLPFTLVKLRYVQRQTWRREHEILIYTTERIL